jgi:hypothetical protein
MIPSKNMRNAAGLRVCRSKLAEREYVREIARIDASEESEPIGHYMNLREAISAKSRITRPRLACSPAFASLVERALIQNKHPSQRTRKMAG